MEHPKQMNGTRSVPQQGRETQSNSNQQQAQAPRTTTAKDATEDQPQAAQFTDWASI